MRRPTALLASLALALPLVPLTALPAAAADEFVSCVDGEVGLAAAVDAANADPDQSTITLEDGCTFALTEPLPRIDHDLVIAGEVAGSKVTLERATGTPFPLLTTAGAGAADLQLFDLTLRNGAGVQGGAIATTGAVHAERVLFADNDATDFGGAIVADGPLTLVSTELTGNTAPTAAAIATANTLTIVRSSVHGNTATSGAAVVFGAVASAVIEHSTLTAPSGPVLEAGGSELRVVASTLVGVDAPAIDVVDLPDGVTLVASVLDTGSGPVCQLDGANVSSDGDNVVGDASCITVATTGDETGVDPLLGDLVVGDDTAPLPYFPLLTGSPAIGRVAVVATQGDDACAYDPFDLQTTDQNGIVRVGDGSCDSGAREEAPESTGTLAPGCSTAELAESIDAANAHPNRSVLELAEGCTYELASALPTIVEDLVVEGGGATILRQPAAGDFRLLDAPFGPDARLELRDLTLAGGRSTLGAGVQAYGPLVLDGVTLRDNEATGSGGAVFAFDDLVATDSSFTDNSAFAGGAIAHQNGTLRLARTSLHGNSTTGDAATAVSSTGDTVIVFGTSIGGGSTVAGGSAIGVSDVFGTATFVRVVFSTVVAPSGGDALRLDDDNDGGSIELGLVGSVLVGGDGAACVRTGPDHTTSSGLSVVDDATCDLGGSSLESVDPMLGAPSVAAGGTLVSQPLLPGSPALDLVPANPGVELCETGVETDIDGRLRTGNGSCDAGAREQQLRADTSITAGPNGTTGVDDATFRFTADPRADSFQCRLDGGPWTSCSAPRSYDGLADGSHTFRVRAIRDGLVETTPATRTWTVDTGDDTGGGDTDPPVVDVDFTDDDDSVFEADIERLARAGITRGCNPPTNDRFCPDAPVTRGQFAAFFARALDLADRGDVDFTDDDGNIFEADIEKLATAGITRGCNPPTNDRFCPDQPLTRGQFAAFMVRAQGLSASDPAIDFADDDTSIFEADIEKLATAGITRGCNPPTNDRFCPTQTLTRGQLAAFFVRAGLTD